MNNQLIITNLYVQTTDGKQILKGVSLIVNKGEMHAIMGPNGGGKSTFAQVLMGHPGYIITEGTIKLNGIDITKMPPDQKAKQGLFLGFQYPIEVAGVNFANFLRLAVNESRLRPAQRDFGGQARMKNQVKKLSPIAFRKLLTEKSQSLAFNEDISKRMLNEGFSGGEKKKAEILQLSILKPEFAILDEPDSGLDVDALKYIANSVNNLDYDLGLILITHYQRILHYIQPDFVHVMIKGKIIKSGKAELAHEVEEKGYQEFL